MDATVALLRENQIKKRLAGVTTLLELLRAQEDARTRDAEYLATLFPDVLRCLRDHNFKVALTALELVELLVPRVPEATVRGAMKVLWLSLVERLGDSKLHVREKAVDVIVLLTELLGLAPILDRLKPCVAHKNWRTREQTVHALWRCLETHNAMGSVKNNDVLDHIVGLLEDSAKEVRDSVMTALDRLYDHFGASLMHELESKNIRSAHMKTLIQKFGGDDQSIVAPSHTKQHLSQVIHDAPMNSTARFLSAIKNRQYDLNSVPTTITVAPMSAPDAAKPNASVSFQSDISSSAAFAQTTANAVVSEPPRPSGMSERDVQRELTKIGEGLRLDNNWSVRVEALKSFQRLAHRCNGGGNALAYLAQEFRSVREIVCAQVLDLRSSVAREACQTLQTVANVLKDDFNPHAEYCIGNILKATYVTIQVISTAADTSIRAILESTKNGYNKVISKLLDGAKTRNQVLRLHCVNYLTIVLQRWNTGFLSRHLSMYIKIMPTLLHDAVGDVRAQARRCFWALHRLFPTEAGDVLNRLDASTQKNIRDDTAARENAGGDIEASTTSSNGALSSSTSKLSIRKEAVRPSNDSGTTPRTNSEPSASYASSSRGGASSGTADTTATNTSAGARRVLGAVAAAASTYSSETEQRPLRTRVFVPSINRTGSSNNVLSSGEGNTWQQSAKPANGALRVLKSAPVQDGTQQSTQSGSTVPLPQRVYIASEATTPTGAGSTDIYAQQGNNSGGPVSRRDRLNGPKRRALVATVSSDAGNADAASTDDVNSDEIPPKAQHSSTRDTNAALRQPRGQQQESSDEGIDEALRRIENSLWSVRLEAVEMIERSLQGFTGPSKDVRANTTNGGPRSGKKVDDRVLTVLIRLLADPHYRVTQAALKSLLSCLYISSQQQVAPFVKAILPKLFQKYVDPKEATRSLARDILEYLVSTYDPSLLFGHVVQQLTDGTNMKAKSAICRYLKELLPGAKEYMHQSANNNQMRMLLTKIAQVLENDAPVSVSSACGDVIQVAASLFPAEIEQAIPMLSPVKRSTISKVLKARGIVLCLSQPQEPLEPVDSRSVSSRTGSLTEQHNSRDFECGNAGAEKTPPASRKRQAQSPLVQSSSPLFVGAKEYQRVSPVVVADVDKIGVSGGKTQREYARSNPQVDTEATKSPTMDAPSSEQFEALLNVISDNNASEGDRNVAMFKTTSFLKCNDPAFWDRHFPRLLSSLLEAAGDRNVRALRLLQKLLHSRPQHAQQFFHPILLGLLAVVTGQEDVAAHLAECALSDVVSAATSWETTLTLLLPLLTEREPPVLHVALQLVRTALETMATYSPSSPSTQFLTSPTWSPQLLAPLLNGFRHRVADVRKRSVDCFVAYFFATHEAPVLMAYLEQHVSVTKQRMINICIDRQRLRQSCLASTSATAMDCSD